MKKVISVLLIMLCLSPTILNVSATSMKVAEQNNVGDVQQTNNSEVEGQTSEVAIPTVADAIIDLENLVSGEGYTIDPIAKTITFDQTANGKTYELIGSTLEYSIIIPTGVDTTIILNNVDMKTTISPIQITGGTLYLQLAPSSDNIIKCNANINNYTNHASGISLSDNGNIKIGGSGSLEVTGGYSGAAIGGTNTSIGTILITEDANVDAIAGTNAAAIGTGYTQSGTTSISTIEISGNAIVTPFSLVVGAGIGTGKTETGTSTISTINILENAEVDANSMNGAAIGTGVNASGMSTISTINISGTANVEAYTESGAAIGIGSTDMQTAISEIGSINIYGDATVNARATVNGAGIGTGKSTQGTSNINAITISENAYVEAYSSSAAAIGTGYNESGIDTITTIEISGSATVYATGGMAGSGIGIGYSGRSDAVTEIDEIQILESSKVQAISGQSGAAIGEGTNPNGASHNVESVIIDETTSVLAAGAGKNAIEDADGTGTANILNISFNRPQESNIKIKVYDQDGNMLIETPVPYNAQSIAMTVPSTTTSVYIDFFMNDQFYDTVVSVDNNVAEIPLTTQYTNPIEVKLGQILLPTTEAIEVSTSKNEPITITLNGDVPYGEPLTYSIVDSPQNGTILNNNDGTITYTPNENYIGTDTFTYVASDGTNNSNTSTVTISITDTIHSNNEIPEDTNNETLVSTNNESLEDTGNTSFIILFLVAINILLVVAYKKLIEKY